MLKVDDPSQSPQGFKDNYNSSGDDYKYDLNGNLKIDNNKEIHNIIYNHLNLPTEIIFSGTTNGTIYYLYNAVGQKINKLVEDEFQNETLTDYLSGFHYENGVLQFFPHAEGYVKVTGNVGRNGQIQFYFFNYVFNYTDHLGNIRLSYAQDPSNINVLKILEENHYYPFGLKHTSYNTTKYEFVEVEDGANYFINIEQLPDGYSSAYKYKYNGKELQDELGLNMYDYGARNYDPALGRWMNIDPLAEQYRRWSPYNYVMNSPMRFIDPDGMRIINGHQQSRQAALRNFTSAEEAFNSSYSNRNLKEEDFGSNKKDWKEYKESRDNLEKLEDIFKTEDKKYQAVEAHINNFMNIDPWGYIEAELLNYTDGNGVKNEIKIIIYSGRVDNGVEKAQNKFFFKDGMLINNIVKITIEPYVRPSDVLSHEIGHIFGLALFKQKYVDACKVLHDCQEPVNRNHTQSKSAMDWQEAYNNLKKYYPIPQTNFYNYGKY
ncbi:RHS repeat-associated core domain-containing protein [Flavobacterium sp. HXWNR69]|uniref:RHS repeat-associated core domain-containing protein n=1 Tax=Flavobacterium fragile TaxID=2949085 RepID=A0ABT0TE13_9FLAO|nr:RHS repeat-associated core domain-containing protein [Flavobacterium sp. HXWNR69]MCL9768856.1 RHS repeat-associated core domain-containing protein [Flavobacterium sp. HXWNR69]